MLGFVTAGRAATPPTLDVATVANPAGAAALAPALARGTDGTVWLSWLETGADQTVSFRCAVFDAATRTWSEARTIAHGADLQAGTADFPQLAAGEAGHATALWYLKNPPSPETAHLHHGAGYRAVTAATRDGGRTWSAPERVTRESDINEFASLAVLADGRVLAAWLDAREKKAAGPSAHAHAHGAAAPAAAGPKPAQKLYARILGDAGPDMLVDAKVCDCCHTTLTAFPDGTALLAYRGRSDEEVRDIRTTRFRGTAWDEARVLSNDDWRIAGCPVNGPQLASDGGRVAAAWFTAAGNEPRVLASFSPDAGARFLMPHSLGEAKPAGRVSTVLLRDGALLVSWVDAAGALMLRRVSPDYAPSVAQRVSDPGAGRVKGFPRLALVRDYAGGKTPAHLLAVYALDGVPGLHTRLVAVPEGDLLVAEQNCDCAPSPEELVGFTLRGTFAEKSSVPGTVRVRHDEVPGLFAAGARDFRVAPELAAAAEPGRRFLGRVERRDGTWWLFGVRLLAAPQ